MSNRYNDSDEYSNRNKHIKNTDNESTQYISPNSDNEDTAEIRRVTSSYQNPQNRQYSNGYNGQQNPQNRQYPNGYNGQQNPQNRQYPNGYSGQQNPQNRQYSPNRQQYYNSGQQGNYQRSRSSSDAGYNGNPQRGRNQNGQRYGNAAAPNSNPQQRRRQPEPPKRKKRHPIRKLFFRIFMILLVILLIIFGVYSCTAISLIKKLNYSESGSRSHTAGALSESYVTSILLIGTDGRTTDDSGRSDTMMLLSVNSSSHTITLTSFLRDSYVSIPGYGEDKLNHAYAYGGADLLMDTIEQNFGVRIDDYVMVNFTSFAAIIDSVGGIDIEISDSEAEEINTILMAEVNELMGDDVDSDLLDSGGSVHLNGKQALSYARIRYVGNADFERTERQREVITEVLSKLETLNPSYISSIAENAIPDVTTNMETMPLYLLSLKLPFCLGYDIEQVQIPADGTYWSTTTSIGGDALAFDFDANYAILEEIYED
ncbi:MAG: LCP family protein [Ruminococcus sp.]|nr:LCP family protein [Ruminococcus sp.]